MYHLYKQFVLRSVIILLTVGIAISGFLGFMFMGQAHAGHRTCITDGIGQDNPSSMENSASCAEFHLNLMSEITQAVPVQYEFTKTLITLLLSLAATIVLWLVNHRGYTPPVLSLKRRRVEHGIFHIFQRFRHWLSLLEKRDPLHLSLARGVIVASLS